VPAPAMAKEAAGWCPCRVTVRANRFGSAARAERGHSVDCTHCHVAEEKGVSLRDAQGVPATVGAASTLRASISKSGTISRLIFSE